MSYGGEWKTPPVLHQPNKPSANGVKRVWFLSWLGLQFNVDHPGFGVPVPLVIVYLFSYLKLTR